MFHQLQLYVHRHPLPNPLSAPQPSTPQVPDTVHKLGATTFVAAVTASTLSLLVPLLVRGLRDRSTPIKRKACLVIDNMSKLVNNPADAAVFLPRLLPGLDAVRSVQFTSPLEDMLLTYLLN